MEAHWFQSYPDYVRPQIDIPDNTIVDEFHRACATYPDNDALISMGAPMSYRQLRQHADRFTSWLQQIGLARGDRVALMLPNVMAYPVCFFGALQGGYVVVNVNPLYTPRELTHQMNDSGARVIVVLESFAHVVQKALPDMSIDQVVVVSIGDLLGMKSALVNLIGRHVKHAVPQWHIAGHVPLQDALKAGQAIPPAKVRLRPHEIALLQYTGGTTGVSKGAALTHGNLRAHEAILEEWTKPLFEQPRNETIIFAILPLYHISALMAVLVPSVLHGTCCVLIANPRDLDGLVKTMAEHKATLMLGINTLYNALLNHPKIGTVDFSRLIMCGSGGAAMQKSVAERWQALTGKAVCEGYGLSETSGMVTVNRLDLKGFNNSVGLPAPMTEISIRNDEGRACALNEPGEICVRGPQVMQGYWNRPDETRLARTSDGFFRTGDVGYMNEHGYLHIMDRKKDMILVSGFNVFPNEVEEVLAAFPGILEAAVVGMEDERTGEAVCAAVVLRDPSVTIEAIQAHCRANLAPYKCPKRIAVTDAIPKTPVGKILRRAVREEWRQRQVH